MPGKTAITSLLVNTVSSNISPLLTLAPLLVLPIKNRRWKYVLIICSIAATTWKNCNFQRFAVPFIKMTRIIVM